MADEIQKLVPQFKKMKDVLDQTRRISTGTNASLQDMTANLERFRDRMQRLKGSTENVKKVNDAIAKLPQLYQDVERRREGLNMQLVKSAAGASNLGNIMKKTERTQDGFVSSTGNLSATLAALIPASSKIARVLKFVAPGFGNMAKTGINAGATLLSFNVAVLAITTILQALMNVVKGSSQIFKTLTGSIGITNTTLDQSTKFYAAMRWEGAKFGATSQDVMSSLAALTENFAVNQGAIKQLEARQIQWGTAIGASIAQFIGLTKVAGLSSDAANALAGNLAMMGADVTKLPDAFVQFHGAMIKSGLNASRLASAIATLAPVSQLSATATKSLYATFGQFNRVFRESTDPIIRFAHQAGRFRILADAMMAFTKAASTLTLPEILAFGGGASPMRDLGKTMTAAFGKEQDPIKMLLNYSNKVTENMYDDNQKRLALMVLLQKKSGSTAHAANIAAGFILEAQEKMSVQSGTQREESLATLKEQLKTSAVLNSAVTNWQDKLIGLVESMLAGLLNLVGIFRGGPTALVGKMMGAMMRKTGPSMGTTPGSGR